MAKEEARGDASLTRNEVNRQKASFELDLVAFFKTLQGAVMDVLEDAIKEGQNGDQVIQAVDDLFED